MLILKLLCDVQRKITCPAFVSELTWCTRSRFLFRSFGLVSSTQRNLLWWHLIKHEFFTGNYITIWLMKIYHIKSRKKDFLFKIKVYKICAFLEMRHDEQTRFSLSWSKRSECVERRGENCDGLHRSFRSAAPPFVTRLEQATSTKLLPVYSTATSWFLGLFILLSHFRSH